MEAGTPPADQTAPLQDRLRVLEEGIQSMQQRVNGDLAALRAQVEAQHDAHDEIDLTVVMTQIDAIIATVASIDPTLPDPAAPDPGTPDTPPVESGGDTPGQPPVDEAPPVEAPPADDASNGPGGDEEGTVGGDPTPEGASPGIVEGDQGEQAQQPPPPDEEWPEGQS